MTEPSDNSPANAFARIDQICREFGKQLSKGESPEIDRLLSQIPADGREHLFASLLATELNYRRSQGESPTSNEYRKRFPQFAAQVRRAFFEPSLEPLDEIENAGPADATESLRSPERDSGTLAATCELGRGGMGVVYEARHTKTNNLVALKTLPTGGDDQQPNAERL